MKKLPLILVLIIILGVGYYFYILQDKEVLNTTPLEQEQKENIQAEEESFNNAPTPPDPEPVTAKTPPPPKSESVYSSGEEAEMPFSPDILVVQINYNGTSFTEASESLKIGDIVIFKNNSNLPMHIASDPHPSHTAYPELDSKTEIAPGGKWQFKFLKKGVWSFHDHLNPEIKGMVTVQ